LVLGSSPSGPTLQQVFNLPRPVVIAIAAPVRGAFFCGYQALRRNSSQADVDSLAAIGIIGVQSRIDKSGLTLLSSACLPAC
jgi:hypothetical protein